MSDRERSIIARLTAYVLRDRGDRIAELEREVEELEREVERLRALEAQVLFEGARQGRIDAEENIDKLRKRQPGIEYHKGEDMEEHNGR